MSQRSSPAARFRRLLTGVALLALGAAGSRGAATYGVEWVERQSASAVKASLAESGLDWASVTADGLMLRLGGTAPDEMARVRALGAASEHVALSRIDDRITVTPPAEATPPAFRVEILRSEGSSSVIGLAPKSLDQQAVLARLAKSANGAEPTDLLEEADYPAPPGWDAAVALALDAADLAPRAKISVAPGQVEVTAVTDGDADKARLEDALRAATPQGVTLTTAISAPRPVIAPFVLKLTHGPQGTRLDSCSASTAEARDRILAAATAAGASGAECQLGLGEPSPQWADAAVAAIKAAASMDGANVTLTDSVVRLTAPGSVSEQDFAATSDTLKSALPNAFALTATRDVADPLQDDGPVSFVATVIGQGVQLRGAVSDDRMRAALESFSGSRFGEVDSALTVNTAAPSGWTVRVLGVLQAMADLTRGSATVTPDAIHISGATGSQTAAADLGDKLAHTLGPGVPYELALTYDPRLDPAQNLPTGETCVTRANEASAKVKFRFAPNRADFAGDPTETLTRLKRALERCDEFRIEVAGHTDSQGSESFNTTLSENRAKAVLTAMSDAGIDTKLFIAKGYGESRPVAENATDEGREENRRIEFRLLSPYPVSETPQAATVTKAVTTEPALAQPTATTSSNPVQMAERLPGPPPDLASSDSALVAPVPTLATAPAAASADAPEITPDELAKSDGIDLRPQEITVKGDKLSTPVPPPLVGPVPEPGADEVSAQRPPARPDH